MKSIFIILFLASSVAFAKDRAPTQNTVFSNTELSGDHNLYAKLIPYKGTFGLGIGYEKPTAKNIGLGGNFTYLPQKGNPGENDYTVGLIAFGANVYLHYTVDFMDFYVAPGLNLMFMDDDVDDKTGVGPSITFGTLAQLSNNAALGLEFTMYQPWFNKDYYEEGRSYYHNAAVTFRWSL